MATKTARGMKRTCQSCDERFYDLEKTPVLCPHCGVRAGAPADPTEDIIVAADQLARAVARATPAQLAAAEVTLLTRTRTLALPSPDRPDFSAPPSMLRAVRQALLPAPPYRRARCTAEHWKCGLADAGTCSASPQQLMPEPAPMHGRYRKVGGVLTARPA